MNPLQICPSYLSEVATLPWEIQKKSFKEKTYWDTMVTVSVWW